MKYLLDKDGNVFKAHIISGIPEGFTDVTENINVDEDAKDLGSNHLEAELIAEVEAIEFAAEYWTNGTDIVYDANDIPVLTDVNGDPYLDPDYAHVDSVEAAEAIPAHHRVKKTATANQEIRQLTMDKLDIPRQSLLKEADVEINILEDIAADSSAWRTYRQALRDVTEIYKENGDWKNTVDSMDVENFVFPTKP